MPSAQAPRLERFLLLKGKVVLLGSDHDAVTFLHYVEHVADFPGKRIARYEVPMTVSGCRVWRDMEEVDTSGEAAHANWPDRFFAKVVDELLRRTKNQGARVGDAIAHAVGAKELLELAQPVMQAMAAGASVRDALEEVWGGS